MTSYWLVELRPTVMDPINPLDQPVYYAGYAKKRYADDKDAWPVTTVDPNRGARFMYRYDATVVAASILSTKSYHIWQATEHIFYDGSDDLDSLDIDDIPGC